MANRSKKVVLSARIAPYLKAALEMFAASQNEKIVKLMETFLESGLDEVNVVSPFHSDVKGGTKISFMTLFTAIWSEDEVVFKIRAGLLGPDYAGETMWRQAMVASGCERFKGVTDLYEDLNGWASRKGSGWVAPRPHFLNLEVIREEWPLIEDYVAFVENNKPFEPSYEDYKRMREESDAK